MQIVAFVNVLFHACAQSDWAVPKKRVPVVAKREYFSFEAGKACDSTGRVFLVPVADRLGKAATLVSNAQRILSESLPRWPNSETHKRSNGGYSGGQPFDGLVELQFVADMLSEIDDLRSVAGGSAAVDRKL